MYAHFSLEPSGATGYEIARSSFPDFSADCTKVTRSATYWDDATVPGGGVCLHYVVRPLAPFAGSWGQDSSGAERANVCP